MPPWPLLDPPACDVTAGTAKGEPAVACLTRNQAAALVMWRLKYDAWMELARIRCE